MQLNELRPPQGARKTAKRKGRGMSSGLGKTSGRGQKGQRSRSGSGVRRGFEGGQMPYFQRLPKRGFTNIFKKRWRIVNTGALNVFQAGETVTPEKLVQAGLVRKGTDPVKILGRGSLEQSLQVQAHHFSRQARAAIEEAGGKAEVI